MKKLNRRWYVLMILCTIIALFVMVYYNHINYKSSLKDSVENIGVNSIAHSKEELENYIGRRMEVVRTTAASVEYMMENEASSKELEEFLTYESAKYSSEIDENFTGMYGYIDGVYIDGAGWEPDEDYDPTTRVWYQEAVAAKGDMALVSPYLDAQTGDIMLSFSKMLADGESVISIDVKMDYLQEYIEGISVEGLGYGFVIDGDGMVVAHHDVGEKGKLYSDETSEMSELLRKVYSNEKQVFRIDLNGKTHIIFSDTIMAEWKIVMVVDETEMFKEATNILYQNIIVSVGISLLIIIFFSVAFIKTNQSMQLEKESNEKVEEMNRKIIKALVKTIDAKDRYTNGHSLRVAEYSREIARRMNMTEKEQETVYYSGLLHDVGKIRIPASVINKAGKLTDEEYEKIKIHPVTSYHIIKDIFDDAQVRNGAKFHHERYDGKGYPNGLKGDNIPKIARIIGVADAYDAMASNRSYRKYLPQDVVRSEIEKCKGTQFDPEIADIMLEMIDEDKDYAMKESKNLQKTILVVDDEPMNIKMVEIILKESTMYEVIGATSGREAIQMLSEHNVDMILLDVVMPEMDGFETISVIREKYTMPIVLMTGDRSLDTIEKASRYGVDDYLTKPFLPLALKEIIHSTLS